jgi:hypothetical protein
MTKKVYRTAMGKTVDIGAMMLQNENIRAVGNMGVNARGDVINNQNKVIESRAKQIQRNNQKKSQVAQSIPTATSNHALNVQQSSNLPLEVDTFSDLPEDNDVLREPTPTVNNAPVAESQPELRGGLAAAIAKAKAVNQERMKTPREQARAQGVRKI